MMSKGQKARNPRYFPKMKIRGSRRRRLAPFQRMMRGFDQLGETAKNSATSFRDLMDTFA